MRILRAAIFATVKVAINWKTVSVLMSMSAREILVAKIHPVRKMQIVSIMMVRFLVNVLMDSRVMV